MGFGTRSRHAAPFSPPPTGVDPAYTYIHYTRKRGVRRRETGEREREGAKLLSSCPRGLLASPASHDSGVRRPSAPLCSPFFAIEHRAYAVPLSLSLLFAPFLSSPPVYLSVCVSPVYSDSMRMGCAGPGDDSPPITPLSSLSLFLARDLSGFFAATRQGWICEGSFRICL